MFVKNLQRTLFSAKIKRFSNLLKVIKRFDNQKNKK